MGDAAHLGCVSFVTLRQGGDGSDRWRVEEIPMNRRGGPDTGVSSQSGRDQFCSREASLTGVAGVSVRDAVLGGRFLAEGDD